MSDDKTPRNTTTTLNANVTAGDVMDERLITQEDGATSAKRAVVALGHSDSRLVGEDQPLASSDVDVKQLLGMILEETRAMRMLLEMALDETSSTSAVETSTAEGELSQ